MTESNIQYGASPGIAKITESLRLSVDGLSINAEVLEKLFPNGQPHDFETALWDYKLKFPVLPNPATEEDRTTHKWESGELIKDVIAFYNSYGGYIVFGVAPKGKSRLVGCDEVLDVGDLNRRIHGYTDANIECLFASLELKIGNAQKRIGLLLVPRRSATATPVRFKKKGPQKPNGTRAFSDETYVRIRDECRPAAASSEDWRFLHSDRTPSASLDHQKSRAIMQRLPARDSDLVEFVGREKHLETLRGWIADQKSPVRLISGIGGLGKTTLAFRFAEEVIAARPEDIECVIWLTAKCQTYSALLGKLVPTGQVDFADLNELLRGILKTVSYDAPLDEEEPSLEEIVDLVVDALSVYSCLVIVDDIDSLPPDEQKETVATLNSIAIRTVGREMPPSRILMTSRIDQGLPPTAVIKITGFERQAFDKYVKNICETFAVAPIYGKILDDYFEATSGSPLFAASIVRLVKLGEDLQHAVETWKGLEGEEVRKFAFAREIGRLDTLQGRLLYAVLLLGETTVNDLAGVLDVTPKAVREKISELQAYHLLASSTKESGDTTILAPSDLIAVTEIMRTHLGSYATTVENACARAQERSRADSKRIGTYIRAVINYWNQGRNDEALIAAKDLRAKFSGNADGAAILGGAHLRVTPPNFREADKELTRARQLGCRHPDLLLDSIKAKKELEDWQGLLELTRDLSSKDGKRDDALDAMLLAISKLIEVSKIRGDDSRLSELAIMGVEKITGKISRSLLDQMYFERLTEKSRNLAREYIGALKRMHARPGDKIKIFDGVSRLANAHLIITDLFLDGIAALETWWDDVERRPVVDLTACSLLAIQLRKLIPIETRLAAMRHDQSVLIARIATARRDLEFRAAKLTN